MRSIFPSPATQGFIHCYKLCGYNIVLDVASGSIHSVDDTTYDVVRLYDEVLGDAAGRGHAPALLKPDVYDKLISRTLELRPDVTEKDIRAIIVDIENLMHQGKLFSPDDLACLTDNNLSKNVKNSSYASHGKTVLKALCLNVSHMCNMSCAYCFAAPLVIAGGGSEGDSAKQSTPSVLMTFDTGKQAIDFLVDNSGEQKTLDIDFFGGEPLLNWKVVKEIVAYARMAEKFTGKKFRFTLTTNGLLIDDDVVEFTNREFHNVVLSLDGRPETHDGMRKLSAKADSRQIGADAPVCKSSDIKDLGSYDAVLPKIRKLVEARRGKGYYIRGTFTHKNMDFANDALHLAGLGFTEISLEPVVTKNGNPLGFTESDLPELFRQYDLLAAEMRRRKENARYLKQQDIPSGERLFDFYHYNIDLEHGPCVHKRIAGCGVATQYLAVTPGGELYPCHQFIGDEEFLIGDVWQGITNKELCAQFIKANINPCEDCKTCWAKYYCSGGCAANAYHTTGSINGTYKIGCELFKKRIENAIMLKFD